MKTIRIEGYPDVSFHEDDTIERVRQLIGLSVGRHPDMLFCEIETELPAMYYTSNPKHWSELFFRMSYDGKTIPARVLETYVNRIRLGTGFAARDVTLDEWESVEGDLGLLRNSEAPIRELRILGVEAKNSLVLPLKPQDIPELKSTQYPIPKNQSLFETLHDAKSDAAHIVRITQYPANASPGITQIYFPLLRPDTPDTLSESLANSILASQKHVTDLLALDAPAVQSYSIIRAKWYIPFISTRFSAPRARFEQIFYGMTVNKTTPYIGYFTSPLEKTRHKFFVEDPKTKVPYLDRAIHNAWLNATQPQRRVPTLLLYRSHKDGELSKDSFDRIIVTPSDIVVSVFRKKDSKDTEETIKTRMIEWLSSLDALTPFVNALDLDDSRWEMGELSIHGSYATEADEFFVRRLPCVQTIFERQGDEFGLLRSEHSSTGVSALESQAYRLLSQTTGGPPTPEILQQALSISAVEAQALFAKVQEMATEGGDFGSSKELPIVSFTEKDVTVRFITGSLPRTLAYVNMLRYVLTVKDPPDICEMMGTVPARSIVPQRDQAALPAAVIADAEKLTDEDVDQFGSYGGARKAKKAIAEGEEEDTLVVRQAKTGTYNYFNSRLQEYDPDTFDKSIYPGKCEKKVQVVVLTPEARKKIRETKNSDGQDYTYETAPETEVLDLEDEKGGVALCPPYWCMRDEIPLREEQLVRGEDGFLHCPIKTCNGKVREKDNQDTQEFTVIKRNTDKPYPDFMTNVKSSINGKSPPCCYKKSRSMAVVLPEAKVDSKTYVLNSLDSIDPLRFAKIPEPLADTLGITTQYATTIVKGSLATKKKDLFCAGLGRHPAQTLPTLLGGNTTRILSPADPEAEANVIRCSFFRTWSETEPGEGTLQARMIKSIDSAYREQRLTFLQELEYVTSFLSSEVIFLDPETYEVECGYWFGVVRESRTIVVIGTAVLCEVSREKKVRQVHEMVYNADINKASFPRSMVTMLWTAHRTACALDVPVLDDAIAEIGRNDYQYILDPFERVQAVYVPGELLLPIEPRETVPNGVTKKDGYANIRGELPTGAAMRAFLARAKHPGYKLKDELRNVAGEIVELRLTSNLRIPIQPEQAPPGSKAPIGEVIQTVSAKDSRERDLVSGSENAKDREDAKKITYANEVYEFLLFSLADDLDPDSMARDMEPLRTSIVEGDNDLSDNLSKWYDSRAHESMSQDPIKFVNKVRTPCGQFSDDPASCNGSSLCAMDGNVCKILIKKPTVTKASVLTRIEQTLRTNEKQRALVLDNRVSPFFSTILYLEMPNELITLDT
jgi:hypothetical protein